MQADTSWMLTASALVSIMIPGLAMYYGGMASSKRILNMIMMTFGGAAAVGTLWVLFGYSLVFGDSVGGARLIGNPFEYLGLSGVLDEVGGNAPDTLPLALFAGFQLMFAAITTAIVAGSLAGRMKFTSWLVFSALWASLVYFPVAHWVFAFDTEDGHLGGWIANSLKAVDFAGGTAVHINAGFGALAVALVLGKRRGFPHALQPASNRPMVLIGAGMLWVGWYAFNAGSALTAGVGASVVLLNTTAAAVAAMLVWMIIERLRHGSATTIGLASALVAGLVGITPACGAVSPVGALAVGAITGAVCFFAVDWKFTAGYDDSLDAFGLHGVGGVVGTVLVGFFGTAAAPSGQAGLFYGGGFRLLGVQLLATVVVVAYTFGVTWSIASVMNRVSRLRVDESAEDRGIDESVHAEVAYALDPSMTGSTSTASFTAQADRTPGVASAQS